MFILGIIHFRTCKFTVIGLDFKNEKKIIPGACGCGRVEQAQDSKDHSDSWE